MEQPFQQHKIRVHHLDEHRRPTAGSFEGGAGAGPSRLGTEYGAQLQAGRSFSPSEYGARSRISTRMVNVLSPRGINILTLPAATYYKLLTCPCPF